MSLKNVVPIQRCSNGQWGCAEMRSPVWVLFKGLTIQSDTRTVKRTTLHKFILCCKLGVVFFLGNEKAKHHKTSRTNLSCSSTCQPSWCSVCQTASRKHWFLTCNCKRSKLCVDCLFFFYRENAQTLWVHRTGASMIETLFEGTNFLVNISSWMLMMNYRPSTQFNDKWQFCVLNDKTWLFIISLPY